MERDWEVPTRARLEKTVSDVVKRVRDLADQLEREAENNIKTAAGTRTYGFQNYSRVAGQLVHEVLTTLPNLNLANVIDAAADADAAWQEKHSAVTL